MDDLLEDLTDRLGDEFLWFLKLSGQSTDGIRIPSLPGSDLPGKVAALAAGPSHSLIQLDDGRLFSIGRDPTLLGRRLVERVPRLSVVTSSQFGRIKTSLPRAQAPDAIEQRMAAMRPVEVELPRQLRAGLVVAPP